MAQQHDVSAVVSSKSAEVNALIVSLLTLAPHAYAAFVGAAQKRGDVRQLRCDAVRVVDEHVTHSHAHSRAGVVRMRRDFGVVCEYAASMMPCSRGWWGGATKTMTCWVTGVVWMMWRRCGVAVGEAGSWWRFHQDEKGQVAWVAYGADDQAVLHAERWCGRAGGTRCGSSAQLVVSEVVFARDSRLTARVRMRGGRQWCLARGTAMEC